MILQDVRAAKAVILIVRRTVMILVTHYIRVSTMFFDVVLKNKPAWQAKIKRLKIKLNEWTHNIFGRRLLFLAHETLCDASGRKK